VISGRFSIEHHRRIPRIEAARGWNRGVRKDSIEGKRAIAGSLLRYQMLLITEHTGGRAAFYSRAKVENVLSATINICRERRAV